jgi:hypothetical protein
MEGTIKSYTWDWTDQQPEEFVWDGKFNFDDVLKGMHELLDHKEYGKIVDEGGKGLLFYRAFTDPFRGRISVCGISPQELGAKFRQAQDECKRKVFSPKELYTLKPVYTSHEADFIQPHVPEVGATTYDIRMQLIEAEKRIEFRELIATSHLALGTVWFDGFPIMVVVRTGDGESHKRWITDSHRFMDMVQYIRTFVPTVLEDTDFVDGDTIIPEMTEYHGYNFHHYYDLDTQTRKK